MRKTNLNQAITHAELKVGDKIRIVRDVTLKDVRHTTLSNNIKAAVVTTDQGPQSVTLAVTDQESVTLLERDEEKLDFGYAQVVTWKTNEDEQFFAVKVNWEDSWLTSDEDDYANIEDLERDIVNSAFGDGKYVSGSFEILFPKPSFANGGIIRGLKLSESASASLANSLRAKIVPARPAFS